MTSSSNRKYITYRGTSSEGTEPWLQATCTIIIKFGEGRRCGFRVMRTNRQTDRQTDKHSLLIAILLNNKKHLKNVGPIRHCEPFYIAIHQVSLLSHAATVARRLRISHYTRLTITTTTTRTTTTTTTRDRGDRYGPIEWAQKPSSLLHLAASRKPLY